MLVWCALLVIDGNIAQRAARQSLEAASRSGRPALPRGPDATTVAPRRAPIVLRGFPLADLSIPRVHLSAVVLHGSDAQTLRRGPGHLENTALPGEAGNVVIAGHRDSFFRPLRNVQPGDDIFMDTPQGRFHYRVTSLRVVKPSDVSVLEPTDTAVLTLITCYPFWVLGDAPDRFVVRATGVVDPTAAAFAMPATSLPESIPAVAAPAAKEPAKARMILNDESLVREAIELFRLTYNARLVSHNEVRLDGPIGFRTCEITITDDQAAASCEVSSQSPGVGEPHVSTFMLERADRGWAIRSVVIP
jgi:sortase A